MLKRGKYVIYCWHMYIYITLQLRALFSIRWFLSLLIQAMSFPRKLQSDTSFTYSGISSYHSVLFLKHEWAVRVSLEQRLGQSKRLGDSVFYNWLKLHVISNQDHLFQPLWPMNGNNGFWFQTHSTFVYYALNGVVTCLFDSVTPSHWASAKHNLIVLTFTYASDDPHFSIPFHLWWI